MADNRLRLMALDAEDLSVVSAHCQDAVLKVGAMQYLPREKRFIVELNRFVWEAGQHGRERRRAVLHFDRVTAARVQGIDLKDRERVLSLLAILFEEAAKPAGTVELVFSGDYQVRLDVECVEAQLTDMKASWQAASVPRHDD